MIGRRNLSIVGYLIQHCAISLMTDEDISTPVERILLLKSFDETNRLSNRKVTHRTTILMEEGVGINDDRLASGWIGSKG